MSTVDRVIAPPTPPGPAPGSRHTRIRSLVIGIAAAAAPAVAIATVVLPGAAGLSGRWPWVALIAFRGVVGVLLLACAVPFLLVALAARRSRATRAAALGLAAVALLGAVGQAAVITIRGPLPVRPSVVPAGDLTVVVTNTDHGGADPAALVRLYSDAGADVVAMPETGRALAEDVARRLASRGAVYQVFSVPAEGTITPTSLLVSTRLGTYRQVGDTGLGRGEVLAEPVGGAGNRPVLVAVHPQAPVGGWATPLWAAGTAGAVDACDSRPDAVLAGDFNSTVDHPALRRGGPCTDAARRLTAAAVATWPQGLPKLFGAALDHVLATDDVWRPVAIWVEPQPGSDHRALVTRFVRVARA